MLKEYVSEAEKEMRLVSEAWVALESEVTWRRRDWSDIDIKINEIVSEFSTINSWLETNDTSLTDISSNIKFV